MEIRILPYLNGNHTFITPMVAMATHTGLEPVIFCVTGRRINQLSQWAILAPIGAICIRLDFE